MKYYLVFASLLVWCIAQSCDPVYVNKVFDNQLLVIGNALRKQHIKYIQIGDVEVSDDIKAYNVKLGDVTRIVRKGDATIQTDEDTISTQAAVGIDKLDLVMDSLEFNGKTYKKALVVVYSNMLSFRSKLHTTKTDCNETYSGLKLSRVQGVMLYSRPTVKMNITRQFLEDVVPFINQKLSSSSFLRYIQKYLNSCHSPSIEDMDIFEKSSNELHETSEDTSFDEDEREDKIISYLLGKVLRKSDHTLIPHVAFAVE